MIDPFVHPFKEALIEVHHPCRTDPPLKMRKWPFRSSASGAQETLSLPRLLLGPNLPSRAISQARVISKVPCRWRLDMVGCLVDGARKSSAPFCTDSPSSKIIKEWSSMHPPRRVACRRALISMPAPNNPHTRKAGCGGMVYEVTTKHGMSGTGNQLLYEA